MLDEFGLAPAVESLARESQRRTGVDIEWSHQVQFDRLPRPLETALYRIIQEKPHRTPCVTAKAKRCG